MAIQHSFTVRYDEATTRDAARAYAWRRLVLESRSVWIAGAALAALTVYLALQGDRSWMLGVFGTVAAMPVVMLGVGWQAQLVNTVGRFRRMKTPEARFDLDDQGVTIATEDGRSTIRWSAITEIGERPGAWMVFLTPNRFFLLPTADVSPETLDVFRAKVVDPTGSASGEGLRRA